MSGTARGDGFSQTAAHTGYFTEVCVVEKNVTKMVFFIFLRVWLGRIGISWKQVCAHLYVFVESSAETIINNKKFNKSIDNV